MLAIFSHVVGVGRLHDQSTTPVKREHLNRRFGGERLVVIHEHVETFANGAENVDDDIEDGVRLLTRLNRDVDAAEQKVVAHQTGQEACIGNRDRHVLVVADAVIAQAYVGVSVLAFRLLPGTAWLG